MKKQEIEILQAIPAAGKTKAILEYAAKTKNRVIIASISLQLSRQSYDFFINAGGTHASIIDSTHTCDSVQEALIEALPDVRVIFITHKTLVDFHRFDLMKDFELFIDEVPEFIEMHQLKLTENLELITKYCNINNNVVTPHKECVKQLEQIAKDGMAEVDVVSKILFPVVRALLQGDVVILQNRILYYINDIAAKPWQHFKKITFACANFSQTLTGIILREFYGWTFVESKLTENLLFTKYPNSSRVEIIVLNESDWSKATGQKVIGEKSVYNVMTSIVSDLTGNIPFIYTTNSYRPTLQRGTKIAYNPHGLNSYMGYTCAAALFSFNPAPWQTSILTHLASSIGLDPKTLSNAYIVSRYLEPTFQLCTRTDIRNVRSNHRIILIVSDLRAAEYLKSRYLPDATINTEHALNTKVEKRKRVETTRNRVVNNSIPGVLKMTEEEKKLFAKWKRTEKIKLSHKNANDVMKARDWICSVRTLCKK
ncbi:MAG: hypothetical protein ACRC3J_09305 [Culicoidibacterales bacterium]